MTLLEKFNFDIVINFCIPANQLYIFIIPFSSMESASPCFCFASKEATFPASSLSPRSPNFSMSF